MTQSSMTVAALLVFGLSACTLRPEKVEFDAALQAMKAGDMPAAREHAARATALAPDSRKDTAMVAWVALKAGEMAKAREALDHLRALDPEYIETIQLTGWVSFTSGDNATAESAFNQEEAWADRMMRKRYYFRFKSSDIEFIEGAKADANYGLSLLALAHGDKPAVIRRLPIAGAYPNYAAAKDVRILRKTLNL